MTYAVDPFNIPNIMTHEQREYWLLFGICVANKPAKVTAAKLTKFLGCWPDSFTPFSKVRKLAFYMTLKDRLREMRFGQYTRIERAFLGAVKVDVQALYDADPKDALGQLMAIPGIGPKTARMYLMYAYPHHADIWVPLDTHILRWMRGVGHNVPKTTPSSNKVYREIEELFRQEAKSRGLTMKQLDTTIWKQGATA